ncbi:integrase, catalytic region, zinc finger, CCHC-type containing protein, partial [Tanacetum coccineum]
ISSIAISQVQEADAPRVVALTDSPMSTSIDQDAPSSSTPSTQEQEHSLNISQSFKESLKTPIFPDDPINESPHEESTSQGSSSNVRQTHTLFEHLSKWTKNHPIANVIGDPSRSIPTRKQLQTVAMWCNFDAFLTSVEPKNFKQAMTEPSWIDAMQEEIHEFQRLEVWHRYAVSSLMDTAYWLSEQQEGIKRQVTTTYTPQQNEVAERMNKTLLERARAMLATASLEKSFCAKAVNTTCYVINRSPSITVKLKTLMEDKIQDSGEDDNTTKETTLIQMQKKLQHNDSSKAAPQHKVNETNESQAPTTRTLNRERKRPVWHSVYVMESSVAYSLLTKEGETSTLQDTLNNADASLWMAVMQEEIEVIQKNKNESLCYYHECSQGFIPQMGLSTPIDLFNALAFTSQVPGLMTYLVANLTLDSENSCVMQSALLTSGHRLGKGFPPEQSFLSEGTNSKSHFVLLGTFATRKYRFSPFKPANETNNSVRTIEVEKNKKYRGLNSSEGGNIGDGVKIAGEVIGSGGGKDHYHALKSSEMIKRSAFRCTDEAEDTKKPGEDMCGSYRVMWRGYGMSKEGYGAKVEVI